LDGQERTIARGKATQSHDRNDFTCHRGFDVFTAIGMHPN
jgi:hypothetical protein